MFQGKFDAAIDTFEQTRRIKINALGPTHEYVASSYFNMAGVLVEQGKYEVSGVGRMAHSVGHLCVRCI